LAGVAALWRLFYFLEVAQRGPFFDHFHIIKLYNDGFSDLRRKLYHEATHVMVQKVLKGTRWLLLKNPENLDSNRREAERLADALQLNQPLALAHYLKEDLRQIWFQEDKAPLQPSFRIGWRGLLLPASPG
jgi:transposase